VGDFHELPGFVELLDDEALQIPRAQALLTAVERARDFSLVARLRAPLDNGQVLECLIVDVETDGVPPNNRHGIQFRERVALCVVGDTTALVEVLALRKSFPILLHQNQSAFEGPASLCLYFESQVSVLRTWTPEKFLSRIQWWLEQSARDQLHPADQPVEHMFFHSKHELILPWNYDELRQSDAYRFVFSKGPNRPDDGFTCELNAVPKASAPAKALSAPIELTLPAIVHGVVERDPATLGELAITLGRRQIELLPLLKREIEQRVGIIAQPKPAVDVSTFILLHFPICRAEGEDPERVGHRAFFVPITLLELGVKIGLLTFAAGHYAPHLGGGDEVHEWRDQLILPMEVLRKNGPDDARRQSGYEQAGPKGVLVGAGSLGSAMLNLWSRGGWGTWTVIDKDHIKPHNLSRHTAVDAQIGAQKADAVAELHYAAVGGATSITPINSDATDFTNGKVKDALSSSELIVDVSTTLEYPRAASFQNAFPRHVSVFVTPDGNASVLLMEDAERTIRLRSVEAQYYRALIQNEWGREHLGQKTGTFWSGASCRDVSLVMPYSRILAHASTLAEQITLLSQTPDGIIRLWHRNPEHGSVQMHDIPVLPEQERTLGQFKLYFDAGAEEDLREMRTRAFPNETGGVLLGYYDFNINSIIVVAGLPAPPDSVSTPTSFKRGTEGLVDSVNEVLRRTSGIVGYIGEWHSHPRGVSARPSKDDAAQLAYLALGMRDEGLPAVQLIVGERDIEVLQVMVAD
jgi:integrative and conjugative element protein (TIGR02256 family)